MSFPFRRPVGRRGPSALLVALVALTACSSPGGDTGPDAPASSPSASSPSATGSSPTAEPSEPRRGGMRVTDTFFGMHDGRVASGLTPDAPVGSLRFWDTNTSWVQLEPSPGQFSWGPLDTAVRAAEQAGARPLLVLGQTPTFHASRPQEAAAYGDGAGSMPDLDAWRRYVTAVVARYGDRLDYQIWNETNVIGYWTGTPRQMAELTTSASRIIRREAPRAAVVAPAFALRLPSQQRWFADFWSLQSDGIDLAGAVDVAAVHLYPPAEDPPETQVELLGIARDVLADHSVDLPVWNTEINFGLLGGPEPPPIPEERQRAFLVRSYLLNAGMGIERVYWYRWDLPPIANTLLTRPPDYSAPSLAGAAFATVREWLDGARVAGCEDTGDGLWRCDGTRGQETRTWWWRTSGPAETVRVDAGSRSWVTVGGEPTRCESRCRVPVGETPVMVVGR